MFMCVCLREVGTMDRGVTRLDGARGRKQVWPHMFEPGVFRKKIYCR